MNDTDAWSKLWALATGSGDDADITPTDSPGVVVLTWGNNDRVTLRWRKGDWQWPDELSSSPGDVGARDSL